MSLVLFALSLLNFFCIIIFSLLFWCGVIFLLPSFFFSFFLFLCVCVSSVAKLASHKIWSLQYIEIPNGDHNQILNHAKNEIFDAMGAVEEM